MAEPYSKERQLARGERRYRRKVASPKQWQAIIAAKGRTCRLAPGCAYHIVQFHHIVPRDLGGDDVADNIAPLCAWHHMALTGNDAMALGLFKSKLTDFRACVCGRQAADRAEWRSADGEWLLERVVSDGPRGGAVVRWHLYRKTYDRLKLVAVEKRQGDIWPHIRGSLPVDVRG